MPSGTACALVLLMCWTVALLRQGATAEGSVGPPRPANEGPGRPPRTALLRYPMYMMQLYRALMVGTHGEQQPYPEASALRESDSVLSLAARSKSSQRLAAAAAPLWSLAVFAGRRLGDRRPCRVCLRRHLLVDRWVISLSPSPRGGRPLPSCTFHSPLCGLGSQTSV